MVHTGKGMNQIKTIAVSETTHRELMQRKYENGYRNLNEVIISELEIDN